jgi:peptidoglycan/xylan/chitin deacetylase (PgdA/CDA1 family)
MQRYTMHFVAAIAVLVLALTGVGLTSMAAPRIEPATETALLPTGLPTRTPKPTHTPSPSPTLPSTPTPTLAQTPIPTPTNTPPPTPHPDIPLHTPNTQGSILVLVYHSISRPEDRWARTPENFRNDLEYLVTHGYYPVNLIDVATVGSVPRGRRPIVLTFDDSTAGHFRYLEDGSIDPDCAMGILLAMHEKYGDDWLLRATFFVLLSDADKPGAPLFRQPDLAVRKVRALVDWGFEVGSHTITHPILSDISAEEVEWELAVSKARIEALVPGYTVRSLALPSGVYPSDRSLVREGYSELAGSSYRYEAVVTLGARSCPSPLSSDFDPYAIPRIQAIQSQLDGWFARYEQRPEQCYVSDGGNE